MKHASKKLTALLLALLLLPLIPIQAQEQPDFDSVVAQANDGYIAYHGFNLRRKPLIAFDENQEDQSLANLLNAKEVPATEAAQDDEEQGIFSSIRNGIVKAGWAVVKVAKSINLESLQKAITPR